MKISQDEQAALRTVLGLGASYGYGNLIAHLATAWAAHLMEGGVSEKAARAMGGARQYPFLMQRDLIERGEWDETGARYAAKKPAKKRKG